MLVTLLLFFCFVFFSLLIVQFIEFMRPHRKMLEQAPGAACEWWWVVVVSVVVIVMTQRGRVVKCVSAPHD